MLTLANLSSYEARGMRVWLRDTHTASPGLGLRLFEGLKPTVLPEFLLMSEEFSQGLSINLGLTHLLLRGHKLMDILKGVRSFRHNFTHVSGDVYSGSERVLDATLCIYVKCYLNVGGATTIEDFFFLPVYFFMGAEEILEKEKCMNCYEVDTERSKDGSLLVHPIIY